MPWSAPIKRWSLAFALAITSAVGASGCLLVPVPVGRVARPPVIVAPVPPVVVAPAPYPYGRRWWW